MGGSGSGRYGWRGVMENRVRLDIRTPRCKRALASGAFGSWTWSRDGEHIATVGYSTFTDHVLLTYEVTNHDDGSHAEVRITLPLRRVPCPFGGSRTYWCCPRCGRRCEVVVMARDARSWGCRRCLRLRYISQGLAPGDRSERRANKIYARLGDEQDDGLVYKPRWMRWRTFNRLIDQANELSSEADCYFLLRLRRLGFASFDEAAGAALGDSS